MKDLNTDIDLMLRKAMISRANSVSLSDGLSATIASAAMERVNRRRKLILWRAIASIAAAIAIVALITTLLPHAPANYNMPSINNDRQPKVALALPPPPPTSVSAPTPAPAPSVKKPRRHQTYPENTYAERLLYEATQADSVPAIPDVLRECSPIDESRALFMAIERLMASEIDCILQPTTYETSD